MRTTMVTGLLDVLARNYNRSVEECALFEMGRVFSPQDGDDNGEKLPIEQKKLAIGGYGRFSDFFVIKSSIQLLFESLGWTENQVTFVAENKVPWLHPGRCANIFFEDKKIGIIGELHPIVAANYSIDVRVAIAQLDADFLINDAVTDRYYKALPKFPAITRDFALVVEKNAPASTIEKIIKKNAGAHMEKIELFDVYEGEQVPTGKKSMAYSVTFRATERTLKDEEVASATERILEKLEKEIGAVLR
jgi:phenylalanyl-tRNA synthetase beta chain